MDSHEDQLRIPHEQPMTCEILDALALEMTEHDALRDRLGMAPRNGKRMFSHEDRDRGHSMGPTARLDRNGDLLVKMES